MKIIKVLLWLLGTLVVLAIGAVLVVTTLVDPNDYKPRIEQEVEEKTGRKLTLQGDLDISFYPWLGLKTGAMTFANRSGFGEEPMLSVEKVNLKAKLMPMLKKELEIGEILLTNPRIRLTTLEDGTTNWGDLLPAGGDRSDKHMGEGGGIAALAVKGVSVQNGTLVIDDRATPRSIVISNLNLSTGEIQPGNPLDFGLSMNIEGDRVPKAVFIELASTINLKDTFDFVKLDNTKLNIEMDDSPYSLSIPAIEVDLVKQTASAPELNLTHGGLNLEGTINASSILVSPAVNGRLLANASDLQAVLTDFGIDLGLQEGFLGELNVDTGFAFLNNVAEIKSLSSDVVVDGQDVNLQLPFAALDLDQQRLDVPDLKIENQNGKIGLTIKGANVLSEMNDMDLAGKLHLETPNLENFLAAVGLSGVQPSGLFEQVSSSMKYTLQNGSLLLSAMDTSADQTKLTGNLNYQGLFDEVGAKLAVEQNVTGIDVGNVLAALDITKNFEGAGNLNLDLNQIDPVADNPASNLGGDLNFRLRDGAIKGFDLQAALIKLSEAIQGGDPNQSKSSYQPAAETKFSELSGSFQGQNGRFKTNDISMKAPAMRVNGVGIVDLNSESLNFELDVSVVDSIEGQGGVELTGLRELTIPLLISGDFASPSFGLDFGKLLEQKAKAEVKKKVEEKLDDAIQDKVKDKLKDKIGSGLKGLLGG